MLYVVVILYCCCQLWERRHGFHVILDYFIPSSSSSKNCREVYGLTTSPFTSLTSSSEKLATGSAILLQSANNGYIRL